MKIEEDAKKKDENREMVVIRLVTNEAVHEFSGVRLPLQPYTGSHAVFMYSTASDGNVTLQLKEPDDLDRNSLAVMLARLQEDSSFSIYTQDTDILSDGGIDVLLGPGSSGENSGKYHLKMPIYMREGQ
ncbi:hypothetical protein HUJ05_013015 [Dendroctonus ponderosae]|nr:hypothetical protein HUJ05_013015 [Dendroctonus ponderosae]